jgi:hypothetical protein
MDLLELELSSDQEDFSDGRLGHRPKADSAFARMLIERSERV